MEQVDRREAILGAVSFAAERLLAHDWEQEIPAVIRRLGEATGNSRAYIFRNVTSEDGVLMQDMMAEWCAPGIPVTFGDPENHGLPYLPVWPHYIAELGAGRAMTMKRSEVSGIDLKDMDDEDILSALFLPIFAGEQWWGYLGFDDCGTERTWTQAEVDVLRAAAGILGAALGRSQTDAAREAAEERYRVLIEQIPAITYIDELEQPDQIPFPTRFVSPQVRTVLGYEPEEFIEDVNMWDRIVHPDDADYMTYAEAVAGRESEDFSAEYRLIAKDGRVVWVHDEARLLEGRTDGRQVWHGVLYDVTALREALEREQDVVARLRALDELKDTFLNAVSHDLRTPVSAILGFALTLSRDEGGLEEADKKEFAERIAANARKLNRLVNDLLDLDRLTRGIIELQRRSVDVERVVARIVEESEVGVSHPITLDLRPTRVAVDVIKVERIVENLVLNADRHTAEGTPLHVSVRPEGDAALIYVEDEGRGVPTEMRESIFDAFTQAELGHSPGVGIGLSLVARFAELHGGRAWVEEREGGGASFRVLLPGGDESG